MKWSDRKNIEFHRLSRRSEKPAECELCGSKINIGDRYCHWRTGKKRRKLCEICGKKIVKGELVYYSGFIARSLLCSTSR